MDHLARRFAPKCAGTHPCPNRRRDDRLRSTVVARQPLPRCSGPPLESRQPLPRRFRQTCLAAAASWPWPPVRQSPRASPPRQTWPDEAPCHPPNHFAPRLPRTRPGLPLPSACLHCTVADWCRARLVRGQTARGQHCPLDRPFFSDTTTAACSAVTCAARPLAAHAPCRSSRPWPSRAAQVTHL
jgi:hypothetical protein